MIELKKEKVEKVKKIKKEKPIKQPKLKSKVPEEQKTMTWEYANEADLTIGETKISNTAKVILILLILTLIGAGIFGYLKRDYIEDYIKQPSIILSTNEVTLEVGSEFDYKNYLTEDNYLDRYELTYPKNEEVDTSTLGDYTVQYKLVSLANESVSELMVHIVDTTAPTIELKETLLTLERGEATEKFNAEKYIKDYSDNYDKKEDLEVIYTETIDWGKDTVEVDYSVTDTSGNSNVAKLNIVVNDPPKEPEVVYVEKEVEVPVYINQGGGSSSSSSSDSSSGGSSSSSSGSESSSASAPQPAPAPEPSHYISGTHDITVSVGTDFNTFASMLTSGVSSDEYVNVDFGSVNLTVPGSYPVTYSTPNVSKSITVTVTE